MNTKKEKRSSVKKHNEPRSQSSITLEEEPTDSRLFLHKHKHKHKHKHDHTHHHVDRLDSNTSHGSGSHPSSEHGERTSLKSEASVGSNKKIAFSSSIPEDDDEMFHRRSSGLRKEIFETRFEFINKQHILSGKKRTLRTWMACITYFSNMMSTYPFFVCYLFVQGGFIPATLLLTLGYGLGVLTQHVLIFILNRIMTPKGDMVRFDVSELMQYSLLNSKLRGFRKYATTARKVTDCLITIFVMFRAFTHFDDVFLIIDQVMTAYPTRINKYKLKVMLFTPIWLLSMLGDLRLLMPLNLAMLIANLLAMFMAMDYLTKGNKLKVHVRLFGDTWTGYVRLVEELFFGASLMPIFILYLRNEMEDPYLLEKRLGIINIGVLGTYLFIMGMGLFAYSCYGKYMQRTLLDNIPAKETLALIIRLVICFSSFIQFITILYIPYNIIFPILFQYVKKPNSQLITEILVRALLILILGIMLLIPWITYKIRELYCCPIAGIIVIFLPVLLIYVTEMRDYMPQWKRNLAYGLLVFGIVTAVLGVIEAFICISM